MEFGRVEGVGWLSGGEAEGTIMLTVTLDTAAAGTRVIRRATVPLLPTVDATIDLDWQVDQYTQETIGTLLAWDGWEVFGFTSETRALTDQAGVSRSPGYLVRRM